MKDDEDINGPQNEEGLVFSRGVSAILLLGIIATVACWRKQEHVGEVPSRVLDHFLCYPIGDKQTQFTGPNGLSLKDQFFDKLLPETVSSRDYVCNPTSKAKKPEWGKEPDRTNTHLVLYGISRRKVTGQVSVTNQLDEKPQLLTLDQQRFLALPSGKQPIKDKKKPPPKLPNIPTNIDHFKCYLVDRKKAPAHGITYNVRDQIYEGEINNLQAVFICNPVEKHLEGKPPVLRSHTIAHLVCYDISSTHTPDTVRIANQFEPKGSIPLDISGPDYLCVPSTKEIVKTPEMPADSGALIPPGEPVAFVQPR